MQGSLTYGDTTILYERVENPVLVEKIRIHVHPNGAVEVETPPDKLPQDISRALYKRAGWISKRLAEAASLREHVLPREYISGETHFYLGKRYQLKVSASGVGPSFVKLRGGLIDISLPHADRAAVKRRLNAWYRERANDYFLKRLSDIARGIPWVQHTPRLKLVAMGKQWGSCSPAGAIHLNPWLVRAGRDCIDYVIMHELCHLQEHNHSKRFYALLDRHAPNWRHVKTRLDGMAELLLAE